MLPLLPLGASATAQGLLETPGTGTRKKTTK
jgi:hypothetical protein